MEDILDEYSATLAAQSEQSGTYRSTDYDRVGPEAAAAKAAFNEMAVGQSLGMQGPYLPNRKCKRCGGRLSTWNPSSHCRLCYPHEHYELSNGFTIDIYRR